MEAPDASRILFLSPFPPRARGRHGGSRAVAELIRSVSARHPVAVLYLREQSEEPMDADVAGLCEWVEAVDRPAPVPAGVVSRLSRRVRPYVSLALGTPVWAQALAVPGFAGRIEQAAWEWRPDVVQFEYHVMGQYADAVGAAGVAKILVLYETGEEAAGRARENPSALMRLLDRRAWRSYERAVLRRMHCVVVLTDLDRDSIARHGVEVQVETIPLGVRIPEEPADPVGASPPSVLFVGNFRHDPNLDAALRLVRDIWPLVHASHPGAVLTLVGDAPPPVLAGDASAGIEVHGSVPAVEPYLARAAVCVAPLRYGGGMRVKVLEALAAGKALVASRLAAAGIGAQDGRELLLADTDAEFGDAIGQLLDDAQLRRELAGAARTWAVTNAGVDRTAASFEALYRKLLGGTA